jgi:hypothetical protein
MDHPKALRLQAVLRLGEAVEQAGWSPRDSPMVVAPALLTALQLLEDLVVDEMDR